MNNHLSVNQVAQPLEDSLAGREGAEGEKHPGDEREQVNDATDAAPDERTMLLNNAQRRERPDLQREGDEPFHDLGGGVKQDGEIGGGKRTGSEVIGQAEVAKAVRQEDRGK